MINIGKINRLKVIKRLGSDIYLGKGRSANVLLVDRKLPEDCGIGDFLDVFVYVDTEGHLAAATKVPKAQVDDIAWLKVVSVNYYGAFLDWGLAKDLLVPFSEQRFKMEPGRHYLVKLLLDAKNRIVASSKIEGYLVDEALELQGGQKVSLLIADKTDLGYKAIVENKYWGVLYQNEVFRPLRKGQKLEGYIKRIREDKKIDLSLYPPGYDKVEALTDKILSNLIENEGWLPLSDKSPPEEIYAAFGVSKKVFKQAIGALYKKKAVVIGDEGIRLINRS